MLERRGAHGRHAYSYPRAGAAGDRDWRHLLRPTSSASPVWHHRAVGSSSHPAPYIFTTGERLQAIGGRGQGALYHRRSRPVRCAGRRVVYERRGPAAALSEWWHGAHRGELRLPAGAGQASAPAQRRIPSELHHPGADTVHRHQPHRLFRLQVPRAGGDARSGYLRRLWLSGGRQRSVGVQYLQSCRRPQDDASVR